MPSSKSAFAREQKAAEERAELERRRFYGKRHRAAASSVHKNDLG